MNFEYISPLLWASGFEEATGQTLLLAELRTALADHDGQVDASQLSGKDPLRALVLTVAAAAMADLGIGVLELQRTAGGWRRQPGSRLERRITGLSGWQDSGQALRCTGPAAAVFANPKPLGYRYDLGERIEGTFANGAGGTTPWGTVLSAEENFQSQVSEAVFADGSAAPPAERPFRWDGSRLDGLGNPFGLAGDKYGWMVEFDPQRPKQPALKHSWLGRFRHEAVAVQARADQPLVVFPGCDRHGGHLYTGQGAILVDAHLAANAVGATPAARPEDTVIDPRNGDLLSAFTAAGRDGEGGSDPAIFRGPGGETDWPHGWVMRLSDAGSAAGSRFR